MGGASELFSDWAKQTWKENNANKSSSSFFMIWDSVLGCYFRLSTQIKPAGQF